MKKTVLVSSILTIALCFGVIAGSTFALFTDSANVDIVVSSGNVEVDAYVAIDSVYSAVSSATADDDFLVDEYGHNYTHDPQDDNEFINGGNADVVGGVLTLVKVTPGDRVDANLVVTNTGDVSMIYRYKIISNNAKLAQGMAVTAEGTAYEALQSYTSEWSQPIAANSKSSSHLLTFELPVYAGNEYQSEEGDAKSVEYTIVVEAVQGNAEMDEDVTPAEAIVTVGNRDELQIALNTLKQPGFAYTINVLNTVIGDVTVTQRPGVEYTINGNGHVFDGALYINGGSSAYANANVYVNDFYFHSDDSLGNTDAYVNFGVKGDSNTRYVNGITINDCIFEGYQGSEFVAIRSHDNGDHNVTVTNCTVLDSGMHSLMQIKNVDGLTFADCVVTSKNGVNLNNSDAFTMTGCTFNVDGYAIRVGESGSVANADTKYFYVVDCKLNSKCLEADDAVIIIRASSGNCEMRVIDSTVNGSVQYIKFNEQTIVYEITNP